LVLHRADPDAFGKAIFLFRRHFGRRLSFTDCTTLAVAELNGVNFVASFDRGFDGLVSRVPS
jgi:predicted nucleic acid-binding protein